jgi:hypothetical protein
MTAACFWRKTTAAQSCTNGVILSRDEKTLYVTNGATLAAFDVQRDGSLTNQREFVKFTAGGGDGATIELAGTPLRNDRCGCRGDRTRRQTSRRHSDTARGDQLCVRREGQEDAVRPRARRAGHAEGNEVANAAQVWSVQMIAQGNKGRAK